MLSVPVFLRIWRKGGNKIKNHQKLDIWKVYGRKIKCDRLDAQTEITRMLNFNIAWIRIIIKWDVSLAFLQQDMLNDDIKNDDGDICYKVYSCCKVYCVRE